MNREKNLNNYYNSPTCPPASGPWGRSCPALLMPPAPGGGNYEEKKQKNEVEKTQKKPKKGKKTPFLAKQKGEKMEFVHLDDVQAPNELPSHVELRVGRPLGEGFELLPNLLVRKNVKGAEGDAMASQDLHHLPAET